MEDVRSFGVYLCELDPARFAASAEPGENENTFAIEFSVFVRLRSKVFPSTYPVPKALWERSCPCAWRGAVGIYVLELGMNPPRRTEIATLPGCNDRLDQLQIRRGHEDKYSPYGAALHKSALPQIALNDSDFRSRRNG